MVDSTVDTTTQTPVTAVTSANALFTHYDIEALGNVFTLCTYTPRSGVVEVFYLVDDDGGVLATHLREMREQQQAYRDRVIAHNAATGEAHPLPIVWGLDIERANATIAQENPAWYGITEQASPEEIAFYGGVGQKRMRPWDLATWEANERLIEIFGASLGSRVPKHIAYPEEYKLVADTDPNYDPINKHPYLASYNGYNYDTTILAMYITEALSNLLTERQQGLPRGSLFTPLKASDMRRYNDRIFANYIKQMPNFLTTDPMAGNDGWNNPPAKVRQEMLNSGRYVDIARLNEVQQKVALKRLLGSLGYQIFESDNLGVHDNYVKTVEDFYQLLAYNVSDDVGLHKLSEHRTYAGAFDLKKGLLDEYPETIYDESHKGSYKVEISPNNIRRNRLRPDSTSAQFVGRILSPYGHLTDMRHVSFMYPSEAVAKELGIERVNVLEETRKFFYDSIQDPKARAEFDEVYKYYKSIEGKNFNDSDEYAAAYAHEREEGEQVYVLKDMPKAVLNIPYYNADGSPTSCFASFSTGGIHGAEANIHLWEADLAAHQAEDHMIRYAKHYFPDPKDLVLAVREQHTEVPLPIAGISATKAQLVIGSDPEKVRWRNPKKATKSKPLTNDEVANNLILELAQMEYPSAADVLAAMRPASMAHTFVTADGYAIDIKVVMTKISANSAEYRDGPRKAAPSIFKLTEHEDGTATNRLDPRYTYTSADKVNHEDFVSYYPNMLRNLSAFWNEHLGTDRYAKILEDKDRYQVMMRQEGISEKERAHLGVLREGTKLILNSASGAGDTNFTGQPIRVNNAIISMRLLGQVFSWRIGQAQALVGARVVSTNTDGLYTILDEEINNRVLEEQSAMINVAIEPEPMLIVSKDSNNRLEMVEVPEGHKDHGKHPFNLQLTAAGGGSLACFRGPRPDKSLAHPAVLDRVLAHYLRAIVAGHEPEWRPGKPLRIEDAMDRRYVTQLYEETLALPNKVEAAMFFQNIVAASSGKLTFPFASSFTDPMDPDGADVHSPRALQHYNRVFYIKPGNPEAISLQAAGAWKVTPAMVASRAKAGLAAISRCETAELILRKEGFAANHTEAALNPTLSTIPDDQDTAVRRVSGVNPSWPVLIENGDLHEMPDEVITTLLEQIDIEIYVDMLAETFEDNWRNIVPGVSDDNDYSINDRHFVKSGDNGDSGDTVDSNDDE